jgi:hypothetical protein
MNKNFFARIIVDLLLFVSVIYGWWVVVLVVSLTCLILFANFIEIIIFGILFDALFGNNQNLGIYGYLGTIVSVAIFGAFSGLNLVLRK